MKFKTNDPIIVISDDITYFSSKEEAEAYIEYQDAPDCIAYDLEGQKYIFEVGFWNKVKLRKLDGFYIREVKHLLIKGLSSNEEKINVDLEKLDLPALFHMAEKFGILESNFFDFIRDFFLGIVTFLKTRVGKLRQD